MRYIKAVLIISVLASVTWISEAVPTKGRSEGSERLQAVNRDLSDETIYITPKPKPFNSETPPTATEPEEEEVKVLEQFLRTYEDGTIEFKLVLSNGLAQFQRITNKEVNGTTIQVYEGYYSELDPSNRYRTTHYIADENGYRVRQENDTEPPVLPDYVPHVPKPTEPTEPAEPVEPVEPESLRPVIRRGVRNQLSRSK